MVGSCRLRCVTRGWARDGDRQDGAVTAAPADILTAAVAEIEAHVHAGGWDAPPVLFALVRAGQFAADDPATAARLGIDRQAESALTPVEQEALPDGPLDEALAGIVWPAEVDGCALSQEIVILPPSAEQGLAEDEVLQQPITSPQRREARLVAGVLRDGSSAVLLRLRAPQTVTSETGAPEPGTSETGAPDPAADFHDERARADDVLTGPDLAPNLVRALQATLS